MQIQPFKLERYFARHEFKARHLLSASDCESLALAELLALADPEGLSLWEGLRLGYTESQGHPLLRAEIERLYPRLDPDDVLVAAPEEAIFLAMNALLAAGDEVIVTWPAYQSLYEIAAALGCRIVRWPLAARDGGWRLDIDLLKRLITPRTRLLVVNFPHNPTGYLPTAPEMEAIIGEARSHGLHLLSDEMYRLLEFDPAARLTSACERYEHGVALSGLSKSFGLPGLRIGWLATRDRSLLEQFIKLKDYTTICSSAPSEILGVIALRAQAAIVRRNLEIVSANLALAEGYFLRQRERFEWLRPMAGPVAFPRLRAGHPIAELCRDLLELRSVMLVPGEMFDFEGNHFRLGLGRKSFPEALGIMAEHLRAAPVP